MRGNPDRIHCFIRGDPAINSKMRFGRPLAGRVNVNGETIPFDHCVALLGLIYGLGNQKD